jgi:hypothetical protein
MYVFLIQNPLAIMINSSTVMDGTVFRGFP